MKDIVEDRLRERALYVCGQFSALLSQSVNLFHLALTLAIDLSLSFSGYFIDPFLSGIIGLFLHVRCIPHQNSQRLF